MSVVEWCVSGAKDLRFIGREVIVCNGEDPILNPLFDFKPMKEL